MGNVNVGMFSIQYMEHMGTVWGHAKPFQISPESPAFHVFIGHWPTKKVQDTVTPKTFVDIQKTFSKHMLSFLKLSLSPGTLDFLIRVFRKAPFSVISFPQPRNPIKSTKKAKFWKLWGKFRGQWSPHVTKYPTSTYRWSCISKWASIGETTQQKEVYLIVERSFSTDLPYVGCERQRVSACDNWNNRFSPMAPNPTPGSGRLLAFMPLLVVLLVAMFQHLEHG